MHIIVTLFLNSCDSTVFMYRSGGLREHSVSDFHVACRLCYPGKSHSVASCQVATRDSVCKYRVGSLSRGKQKFIRATVGLC